MQHRPVWVVATVGAVLCASLVPSGAPAQVKFQPVQPQETPTVKTLLPAQRSTITSLPAPAPAPLAPSSAPAPAPAATMPVNVGAGVADITGPVGEVTMMGYAHTEQVAAGLQSRLWARAFAFSTANGQRFVWVSAELGQLFSSVKQGVIKRLATRLGPLYDDRNVMISATHTHAGPGGYSHHAIYNFTSYGFVPQNYEAIVAGITEAIVRAHQSLSPATMKIATGDVQHASVNRGALAYDRNPDKLRDNVNREMTVLRIDRPSAPAGVIAWFGVHNTSLTRNNRLVSSDHKGYASWRFEEQQGTLLPYQQPGKFVAAFPNAEEGDVSPNTQPGFKGPGADEFDSMRIIGQIEVDSARRLFDSAWEKVSGPIDVRHTFVQMYDPVNRIGRLVGTARVNGAGLPNLCQGAYGFSFAAGAKDGPTGSFREGMLFTDLDAQGWENATKSFRDSALFPSFLRPAFNVTRQTFDDACQRPKPVLMPSGALGWTPNILPFQLMRVGSLAIAGVPSEMTTQAGRRLKERIRSILLPHGVTRVVITGLANEYSGYVSTPEEYDAQLYEGASTLFGRLTLDAYIDVFVDLANRMAVGQAALPGPTPPDLSGSQISLQTNVIYDSAPVVQPFGTVLTQPPTSVVRGSTLQVTFRGAHPKNDLKTNDSYFFIEKKTPSGSWGLVAWDAMPEARMAWRLEKDVLCSACSRIDIRWDIPLATPTGTYRVRHKHKWKNGLAPANNNLVTYEGITREFQVL